MKISFMHPKTILLTIMLIGCAKSDPFPALQLPIYPSAINPNKAIDSPVKGAKSVVYDVAVGFPAKELTDFYNQEMEKIGFFPFPEKGIGTFKWEDFNAASGDREETSKVPARYTATWVNSEKTQKVWLCIYYKPRKNCEKWENIAMVSCNMAKYFDIAMAKRQLENINK